MTVPSWVHMADTPPTDDEDDAPVAFHSNANQARFDAWYTPDCGYLHVAEDGVFHAVCPDGVPHWSRERVTPVGPWLLIAFAALGVIVWLAVRHG